MGEWIFGRNPVYEVLRAQRRHPFRLITAQEIQASDRLSEIMSMCKERSVPIERAPRNHLDRIAQAHQGVVLETSSYPYCEFQDILELAKERQEPPLILLLDALKDPQNLGTLLRTAEIVGAHGALMPLRRTVSVTPAVVSASAGASEHMLIAKINLAQAIQRLKDEDIWVVGLESGEKGKRPDRVPLDGPLALVVGSEGRGLRSLVRESCDILLHLPMRGEIASLNASVAGSVALYLAWQQRGFNP